MADIFVKVMVVNEAGLVEVMKILLCIVILGAMYDECTRPHRPRGPTELDKIAAFELSDLPNELHTAFQERKKTEPDIVLFDFAQKYLAQRGYLVLEVGLDSAKQEPWIQFQTASGDRPQYIKFPNREKDK